MKLDPRTKLYMILIVSAVVMMSATTPFLWGVRIVMTLIPIILLVIEKRYTSALGFIFLYTAALVLTFAFLSEDSTGIFKSLLTGYSGIVVQFMPCFITAWYVVRTTKIDEFMSAMQRMHLPDGITISLAVVMRFFPTIKEEYSSISDAMRMRGISFGGGNAAKMIEYRMIPLLFSCVNIGDELSAAAITRGLGGNVKRTSVEKLKLRVWDWLLITAFTAVAVVFVVFKYFL
ncbi:energy-coupling factor transporter transmembrane component T [Butyrivibrio sp. AE2032]|uniref:energy-coupling factor transporter transmembrane component T n=1 Tax=Butyrivibrio sp. AE2032 TaxID=1458463 RepID=UPI000829FFA5|nr:energy-coupling factor transporter transmembrane component T [Butyrivibrio sp. AE2032]